jgi:hypothetical protein
LTTLDLYVTTVSRSPLSRRQHRYPLDRNRFTGCHQSAWGVGCPRFERKPEGF